MGGPTMTFGSSTTPTKQPLDGYFSKGQWLCNCQPRLPAARFQVRRETKNKGRWFYTCQKDRAKGKPGAPEHCGFFLFADDAQIREQGAVLNNSSTEPSATQTPSKRLKQTTLSAAVTPATQSERRVGSTPISSVAELGRQVGVPVVGVSASSTAPTSSSATMRAGDKSDGTVTAQFETDSELESSSEDELSQPAPSTAAAAAGRRQTQPEQTAGAKRKRPVDESEEDFIGEWSSDEERQAALITDSVTTRGTDGPGRTRDAFATPATSRTVRDTATGLATPSLTDKPTRRVLFAEPAKQSTSAKRQRTDESGSFTRPAAATTPSSSQESATTPGSHAGALNVTETVMGLLRGQQVSDQVRAEVRAALQKFEARAKGLERGRDASRQAVKNLEQRIATQQDRIVDLENQRGLDAQARQKIRSGMMKLYSEN